MTTFAVWSNKGSAAMICISGLSGTGKSTVGDYLDLYCGIQHVDGDNIMQRGAADRPEWKQVASDINTAIFEYWLKTLPCADELWQPYLRILCDQVKEAALQHRVAVTWVFYRREVRDFMRAELGESVRFLRLDCDVDVLVEGTLARLKEGLQMGRMSIEQWWSNESPAMQTHGGLQKYGPFSYESYKQMQLDTALGGMVDFGNDETGVLVVDVSCRGAPALLKVSAALGLTPSTDDIDVDKVRAVNSTRVKKIFAEMEAPSAVAMGKYAKPRDAPGDQWAALLAREGRIDGALTVRPTPLRHGPTTQDLLASVTAPRTFVRVRPLLGQESSYLEGLTLDSRTAGADASGSRTWVDAWAEPDSKAFRASSKIGGFDGVFGCDADSEHVFRVAVQPALPPVIAKGSSVSVFCYGHSGTGKTHSMLGYAGEPGIFTQTAQFLLDQIRSINDRMATCSTSDADGPLTLHVRFVVSEDLSRHASPRCSPRAAAHAPQPARQPIRPILCRSSRPHAPGPTTLTSLTLHTYPTVLFAGVVPGQNLRLA